MGYFLSTARMEEKSRNDIIVQELLFLPPTKYFGSIYRDYCSYE